MDGGNRFGFNHRTVGKSVLYANREKCMSRDKRDVGQGLLVGLQIHVAHFTFTTAAKLLCFFGAIHLSSSTVCL